MSTPPPSSDVWTPLDQPRALTPVETWIARGLAAAAGRELLDRIDQATIVGRCRYGCSSVQLTTHAPPLSPAWHASRSPRGREDHPGIRASVRRADGPEVTATLHVITGVIIELELFDPQLGEGHPVDPSTLTFLDEAHLL